MLNKLMEISSQPEIMTILSKTGKVLLEQEVVKDYDGFPNAYGYRGKTVETMYNYTLKLGVNFIFNATITDYFEAESSAGILFNGEKKEAD